MSVCLYLIKDLTNSRTNVYKTIFASLIKKTLEKVLTMCGVIKVSKQKLISSVCFLLNNKIIYFYVIYFLGKNNKHSQNVNKFSEKYIKDDKLFD